MAVLTRSKNTVYGLVSDLTTLQSNIDNEAVLRDSNDTNLQNEIDATQTGAGLGTNGSYSANIGTNYIGAATSLVSADELLDAAIKTEKDRAVSVEGTLSSLNTTVKTSLVGAVNEVLSTANSAVADVQTQLNTEVTNRIADVDAEESRALAAEAVLQANISAVETAYLAADSALDARLDLIEGGLVSGALWKGSVDAVADLDLLVEADVASGWSYYVKGTNDAYVVISETDGDYKPTSWTTKSFLKIADYTEVSGLVTSEETRAIAAEAGLQTQITAEVTRATSVEGSLANLSTTNKTTLVAAINEVDANVDAEVIRATGVEATISANLASEISRATGVEDTLQSNIDAVVASVAALDADTYSIAETDEAIRLGGAIFVTEVKVVTADKIALTHAPKNGMIFNFATVRHTDANFVSYDIPVTITATAGGKELQLYPNTTGEFDTKNVTVQYAYIPVV